MDHPAPFLFFLIQFVLTNLRGLYTKIEIDRGHSRTENEKKIIR